MKLRWSIRAQLFALVLAVALPFVALLAAATYSDAEVTARQARTVAGVPLIARERIIGVL